MRSADDVYLEIQVAFLPGHKWNEARDILLEWSTEIESEAYERGYQNGYAMCQNNHGWNKVEANL